MNQKIKVSAELSSLVEARARIVNINNVQQPGFNFNQENVDILVRLGFKPTDSVYELTVEFEHGLKRNYWMKLDPDLYSFAQVYQNINSPEDIIGEYVLCEMKGSVFSSNPIQGIRAINYQD
jgi:hypothetical protein